MYESLEKLGLTRNEVTIYKYLLRKGVSSGAQIWGENSLDKSSAYRAIGQLQEKRLIYAIGETRNQKFAAYPVEALRGLHQKVASKLEQVSKDIDGFVENINEYAKEHYKSSRIQLYEGVEGYKLFSKQRLDGHVDIIRQIGPTAIGLEGFHEMNKGFIDERIRRGVSIKLIHGKKWKRPKDLDLSNKLKEIRQVNVDFDPGIAIATHGDSTSYFTEEDGKFMGLVIKDRLITNMFNMLFDIVWETGTKV